MPKESLSNEEFLKLVAEYEAKDADAIPIPYDEAKLKNYAQLIELFENLLTNTKEDDKEQIEYYNKMIESYKKEMNKEDEPPMTEKEMLQYMHRLQNTEEFESLILPVKFMRILAKTNEDALEEIEKMEHMKRQVKAKDEKTRLENYKQYLLQKIDRKKLDNRLKK